MKTSVAIRHFRSAGLTLVELLVVIAIIAVLVGFILPCMDRPAVRGRLTDSLSNCKQINLALRLYAGDHDGKFPSLGADGKPFTSGDFSNRAFEQLMPTYSSTNKIFVNKASAWCKDAATDAGQADAFALKRGQNDWNYVTGLTDEADPEWPLIATATQSATNLTYTNDKTAKGGVWGGTDAIIAFADGSARPLSGTEMDLKDKTKTFPKRKDNGASMFIATPDWLGAGRVILAPE